MSVENNSLENYNKQIKDILNTNTQMNLEQFIENGISQLILSAGDLIHKAAISLQNLEISQLNKIQTHIFLVICCQKQFKFWRILNQICLSLI